MSADVDITCQVDKQPHPVSTDAIGSKQRRSRGGAGYLETLYGVIGNRAIALRVPKHAHKELEAYPDRGPSSNGPRCPVN